MGHSYLRQEVIKRDYELLFVVFDLKIHKTKSALQMQVIRALSARCVANMVFLVINTPYHNTW